MKFHHLSASQITQLEKQGCTADSWETVLFKDIHCLNRIKNVHFSGTVKIGKFNSTITSLGGYQRNTGIYNAKIFNCEIGDNVFISGVNNYMANYIIEKNVQIENVNIIATEEGSYFGNGTLVNVINESGGREIPIYDKLSAHLAYILSLYRHRSIVIQKIKQMIKRYNASIFSSYGRICRNVQILNCDQIIDIKIGEYARLKGLLKLKNGSINSTKEAPVYIGVGVIARNFIICSGSALNNSTQINNCFVGQGCILDKNYSAVHSVFFANCQGFHGEACSLFAGPYTVTHHKSTLLIAGLFSFMNAGSGSNQSNHMYKLGPIHQGVIERGAKTTSDSYLLWPAKIGAFTLVMGRHYKNADTSNLPFSYLIENKDESVLVPGINLRSVGTVRDAKKFPKRDIRTDSKKFDYINFNLLSPYTVYKMMIGRNILISLQKTSGELAQYYTYHGMKIMKASLRRGIYMYEIAIHKFLGNSLISRLNEGRYHTSEDIRKKLMINTKEGKGKWIDMVGLICPLESLLNLLNEIENDRITTLDQIDQTFKRWHEKYYDYEWTWAYESIEKFYRKKIHSFTAKDIIKIIEKWKESVVKLDEMLYEDAKKEFSLSTRIGFGVDGDEKERKLDFKRVRGDFETDDTVREIKQHIIRKTKLGDAMITRMKAVMLSQKEKSVSH